METEVSGNKERVPINFPRCKCHRDSFWIVAEPDSLSGLCFHPEGSYNIRNHKIYNMRKRNLQKSQLKKITKIRCAGCDGFVLDEIVKEITKVAEIIFDEEWEKSEWEQ